MCRVRVLFVWAWGLEAGRSRGVAAQAPAGDRLADAAALDWVIYGLVAAVIAAIWMHIT